VITAVDVVLRELPLTQVQMKGRTPVSGTQQSVFVRVTGDSGLSGYGEASAWAVFSEQNAPAMAAVIRGLLAPAVVGRAEHDRAGLHRAMDAAVPGNQVAKAAVDMAVHDLVGRQADLPVCDLVGGDARFRIALSYSVSVPDPDEITRVVARRSEAGYRIFKLKVGAYDIDDDLRRLAALRAAAPDASLRLDYNGRADERGLRAILGPARDADVDFCEQPFPAHQLDRTERLRSWFDLPVSLDETVTGVDALETVLRRGVCDIVSVKFGRSGGTQHLVDMTRLAQRYGVGVYCGGFNETRLGVAAAMHAFSTVGALVPGCDFYFPYEVLDDSPVEGGPVRADGELSLRPVAGHGATLPDEWFEEKSG
jgi:muconate cycloisomerase